MVVREVAPGVFVATGSNGANYGLIQTHSGAVLVDAPLIPAQARAWRAQIEQLAPNGIAYMINTDYHLGHALGTCYLPPALTIAHEATWKALHALDRETAIERALAQPPAGVPDLATQLADMRLVLPEMTVGKSMTLWCEGRRIDLLHLGGHTPGTLGVHLPEERLLFTGDLVVNGCHPYAGDCVCLQWLASLERIQSLDLVTLVPGHGEPAGPEIIAPIHNYLLEAHIRVGECFRAGHTRRETVERVRPLDAFPYPPEDEERLRRMLRSSVERIYDEIKKAALRARQGTR